MPPAFSSAIRILQGDDRLKMVKVIQLVATAGLGFEENCMPGQRRRTQSRWL
jgi:hypothetical protein